MKETIVYVCDSQAQAVQARNFLLASGYTAAQITSELTENFIYDAVTYDSGLNDAHDDKWVVIGRK